MPRRKRPFSNMNLTNTTSAGSATCATGEIITEAEIEKLRTYDAIYLGAVGHPDVKAGILEKGLLLKMRFDMDQYINLRPVKLYPGVWTPIKDKGPEEIDFVVVRENTEDYTAARAVSSRRARRTRCAARLDQHAQGRRALHQITLSTIPASATRGISSPLRKTNVLTYAFDLWERNLLRRRQGIPRHQNRLRAR